MRLLLDTHALLWALSDSPKLSIKARAAIMDPANERIVSAASAFEITTKHRLGKLPEADRLAPAFDSFIAGLACTPLAISIAHAATAGALSFQHGDPFDRILIAQAQIDGLTLVSNEALFDRFGIDRLW